MIKSDAVKDRIKDELIKANTIINPEVWEFLKDYSGPFSDILKENVTCAKESGLPLCQDTGMVEFFVFQGNEICFDKPLDIILNSAVEEVYSQNPYRYSVLEDPIFKRKNTGNNLPSIVHVIPANESTFEVKFLVKGGGSENLTFFTPLEPGTEKDEIVELVVGIIKESGARGCPPLNVGIGIGGSSELSMLNAKLALFEGFGKRNPDPEYKRMEEEIILKSNDLKIGFQALGTGPTVYTVHIRQFAAHIATLPLSVAFDCYLARKGEVRFEF